jgi:translation initiation factor 6
MGALVHPDLGDKSLKEIEKTLKVPVSRGTIGSSKTVGMAAVVTNRGLLCHPKVTDEEKRVLEKVFDVNVMIGTVNHGSPVIGSGLVANANGAIIGNLTTGIEMGRIEEALGFLD